MLRTCRLAWPIGSCAIAVWWCSHREEGWFAVAELPRYRPCKHFHLIASLHLSYTIQPHNVLACLRPGPDICPKLWRVSGAEPGQDSIPSRVSSVSMTCGINNHRGHFEVAVYWLHFLIWFTFRIFGYCSAERIDHRFVKRLETTIGSREEWLKKLRGISRQRILHKGVAGAARPPSLLALP
jgi:hypothetical protein